MGKGKIAITLDEQAIDELDRLVEQNIFRNRSQAVQEAVSEKLERFRKTRLARESSRLNPDFEKQLAEESLILDIEEWPEY